MKRKNPFAMTTYWESSNFGEDSQFYEDNTFEDVDADDLTSPVVDCIKNFDKVILKNMEDGATFLDSKNTLIYDCSVRDIKKSTFLRNFLFNGEEGDCIVLEKNQLKGVDFNKRLIAMVDYENNEQYIDRDCPKCQHLLKTQLEPDPDEPVEIVCSNCDYLDDSQSDFSVNIPKYEKALKEMRSDGAMEITGETFEKYKESLVSEKDNKDCPHCTTGKMDIVNLFLKMEDGESLYRSLSKCERCHMITYTYQMGKNSGIGKLFDVFGVD